MHPKELMHGRKKADHVHNIYGHTWAQLVAEGYKKDFPTQRPFILMRAGYSGSQRFGLIPWSGDVNRTWGGLQSQPEIALQMGMQGLGYMHSDLGGFAGENLDDELYTRWLQYGVFQPIFRPHAQEDVPSEPIFRSEKAKSLAKKAIELRYEFLPYNYNLAFQNSKTGAPLMRPLFFEESENRELYNYSKTYLWGPDILVSPILEAGKTSQEVYFPKGNKWFDFYTDEVYDGGKMQTVAVNEETLPTFVRAGAIIPLGLPYKSTAVNFGSQWNIHYYFDENSKITQETFYHDVGPSMRNSMDKGNYVLNHFKVETGMQKITIELENEYGSHVMTNGNTITFVVHNISKQPKGIKIDGKSVIGMWDANLKTVSFPLSYGDNTTEINKIKIKLNK